MKKPYQKPQVTQIKLVVKEMVLGACWSSSQQASTPGNCNISIPGACPFP